ncbi:MAG: hypothetical protein OHK0046_40720 [Anaerolineae bacterium]
MAQYTRIEVSDMAESSPQGEEGVTHKITSEYMPMIFSESEQASHPAETGLVPAVQIDTEGKEKGDSQDASLTPDEAHPVAEKKVEADTPRSPMVLIVEDTTELAEIIQATLERRNMVVVHETHGNKAIEKFKELNPDVVLLDISLPDMTGWKIMDAIKERMTIGGKMPVTIVITAYDDPANRLVGKLQGVQGYLIKPFTSDEIEKAVTQAISSSTR